jgi:hypothetical protein
MPLRPSQQAGHRPSLRRRLTLPAAPSSNPNPTPTPQASPPRTAAAATSRRTCARSSRCTTSTPATSVTASPTAGAAGGCCWNLHDAVHAPPAPAARPATGSRRGSLPRMAWLTPRPPPRHPTPPPHPPTPPSLFHKALKEAFEAFCNKSVAGSTSAELFANFCDNLLKKARGQRGEKGPGAGGVTGAGAVAGARPRRSQPLGAARLARARPAFLCAGAPAETALPQPCSCPRRASPPHPHPAGRQREAVGRGDRGVAGEGGQATGLHQRQGPLRGWVPALPASAACPSAARPQGQPPPIGRPA